MTGADGSSHAVGEGVAGGVGGVGLGKACEVMIGGGLAVKGWIGASVERRGSPVPELGAAFKRGGALPVAVWEW